MTWTVPDLPDRYILDLRTECNLKCPMCLLHGAPDTPEKEAAIGKMGVENARKILDEIMAVKPMIQPAFWGEPTLAKDLREHIVAMKERGISVAMNTNGLTMKPRLIEFLIAYAVDAVFFSLDAITPQTLKKVRGIDRLDKIEKALLSLLWARNTKGAKLPRVGATFTIQDENAHELDEFIDRWVRVADVVRVGHVFKGGRMPGMATPEVRVPCRMLYQTMPIHHNGDVSMCCFDSHGQHVMGNVFKDGGVKAVWHGAKYQETRRLHETGDYDAIPFCKDCNAWAGHLYEETIEERADTRLLVRRSPQFTYYNRIDRLDSWHGQLRGHEPPAHAA